jgi:hypothetical protein
MLELLVIKRICRCVYFTRLPVGHTHADIDVDEYKLLLENQLSKSAPKVKVHDIIVVPDYDSFLEGSIDPKLQKLHKALKLCYNY